MEELFRDYWWLIFPIFGMSMGLGGMVYNERRTRNVIDLIKSYTDQGKEPPPELLKLVSQQQNIDEWGFYTPPPSSERRGADRIWSFVTFAALAAGFGVAYFYNRAEDWSWAFLAVTVAMGVMAVGALLVLLFVRK